MKLSYSLMKNEVDDMTLYALGLKSEEEMKMLMDGTNGRPLIMR